VKFINPSLQVEGSCSKMHIMQVSRKSSSPIDNLINKLEQYRLKNRIPQQELADEIGVVFSTVSRWLTGKTRPNKIQQYHIENFLKKKGL
jgi:DNA-binding XRE family transcriptional regulator